MRTPHGNDNGDNPHAQLGPLTVPITVNHVMSNDVKSQIFTDILGYFDRYSVQFAYQASAKPIAGALVRHYHRPNLESKLINPAIVTVHHDLAETDDWLHFSKYEAQYRQADKVICLNQSQQRQLADAGIHHTCVIPHGYNDQYLRSSRRHFSGNRKLVLGVFSRRYARKVKGEAYLQELLKRLDPDHYAWIIVGQDRAFEARFARKLGFEVKCYESLPYPVLCHAYGQVDLLMITSRFEGGPANVPEALATATPIATSPVGMALDSVEHGVNGLILSMDADTDALTLGNLYRSPKEMNTLFKGAKPATKKAKPWRSTVEQHEQVYARLVDQTIGSCHG